jgi:hypothetical protein
MLAWRTEMRVPKTVIVAEKSSVTSGEHVSYDLNFWKYCQGVDLEHQAVYERLSDGEHVDGLEDLPIATIRAEIAEAFREGWEQLDADTWESSDSGMFQLFTTPQFFRVDCYGMDGEIMNRFTDVLAAHGAPLFDPQIGRRFTCE